MDGMCHERNGTSHYGLDPEVRSCQRYTDDQSHDEGDQHQDDHLVVHDSSLALEQLDVRGCGQSLTEPSNPIGAHAEGISYFGTG